MDKERSTDNQYHGQTGRIVDIEFDDAGTVTGNPQDSFMYTVELENGETPDIHFRRSDLRTVDQSPSGR